MFPPATSTVLPDPARFFAPGLLSAPLPTNSFFQNFALGDGDMPEYIHPYLIRSAAAGLTVCYPRRSHSASSIVQAFVADLTVSSLPSDTDTAAAQPSHRIAAFDDLSVTLDVSPSLRAFLVRGCPYVTVAVAAVGVGISAAPCDGTLTKWRLRMTSGQTFLSYADAPIQLSRSGDSQLSAPGFSVVVRVAYLPDAAMPQQVSLCPGAKDFRYRSIDGDLVGDSWLLNPGELCMFLAPSWHSREGIKDGGVDEIVAALRMDVDGLASSSPITTTSCYLYGKAIARAATLALIAEEVRCPDVIPEVRRFLTATVTPWLDGTFQPNGFLYDPKWGGLLTRQGLTDSGADSGFGMFNEHHYQLGYFVYAIAVLVRIDPSWGREHRPQAYSVVADYLTLSRDSGARCTRLRNFDLWKLHSWAGERTGEAVNAYYSAKLLGLIYKDSSLVTAGTTLAAFEMLAAHTWWHVPRPEAEGATTYEAGFSRGTRVVGVVWANKRDSRPSLCPPEWKERRVGMQVLPLLPTTRALFLDIPFVRELVAWSTTPASSGRQGAGDGWKGFVHALEGIYDKYSALEKARALTALDDGNSLTNLLWWLHSRCYRSHDLLLDLGHGVEILSTVLYRPRPVDELVNSLLEDGDESGVRAPSRR
ncbi:hypothetical protein VPH35_127012 [Triticum aestivum]